MGQILWADWHTMGPAAIVSVAVLLTWHTIREKLGRAGPTRAYALGVLAYFSGRVLSALLDLPSGPVIVWMLAGLALVLSFRHSKSRAG